MRGARCVARAWPACAEADIAPRPDRHRPAGIRGYPDAAPDAARADLSAMSTRNLRTAASLAGLAVMAVLSSSCSYGPTREAPPQIPAGIPPAPGEPVPAVDIHAPGRTSDQLRPWAQGINEQMNIPQAALAAYGNAAETMRQTQPECNLAWTTLAGIGHVETRHGRYGGATMNDDGYALPPIIGIKLDGTPGFADIPDTDGGALDGDPEHDRAVGPMQFIPSTWVQWGADGDGDGANNPQNIDDSALAAARYLCASGGNLADSANWIAAVHAYNPSVEYNNRVADAAEHYANLSAGS